MTSWKEKIQSESHKQNNGTEYRITIEARKPGGEWMPLAAGGKEVELGILDGFLMIGHQMRDEYTECIPVISQNLRGTVVAMALGSEESLLEAAKKAVLDDMVKKSLEFDLGSAIGREGGRTE